MQQTSLSEDCARTKLAIASKHISFWPLVLCQQYDFLMTFFPFGSSFYGNELY